jgi:hypothetical protein
MKEISSPRMIQSHGCEKKWPMFFIFAWTVCQRRPVKLDIHTFIVEKVCCRHHRLENTCKRLVLTRARGSTLLWCIHNCALSTLWNGGIWSLW